MLNADRHYISRLTAKRQRITQITQRYAIFHNDHFEVWLDFSEAENLLTLSNVSEVDMLLSL